MTIRIPEAPLSALAKGMIAQQERDKAATEVANSVCERVIGLVRGSHYVRQPARMTAEEACAHCGGFTVTGDLYRMNLDLDGVVSRSDSFCDRQCMNTYLSERVHARLVELTGDPNVKPVSVEIPIPGDNGYEEVEPF